MQDLGNTLRMATFIQQLEAGRSENVAAMVVEAMYPFGKLGERWAGPNTRKVKKLARLVAKNTNPKKG